jgi:hypothetical protein
MHSDFPLNPGVTSNEPMIMEMTASVSKALQEYERAGSFASAAATDTEDATLAAPAARVEPTQDASAPPRVDEGREVSPPRSVEATKAPAPVAKLVAVEAVVGEEGRSSPGPVAAEAEGVEARVLDEPAAIAQESAVPEMVARATTPEIQVAEETGASLSQGAAGGEARMLELARTSSTATSGLDSDSEGDEEAVVRDTLERGMTWARRAFDELILPVTSVSFLVKDSFLIPQFSRALSVIPVLLVADPRVFRSEMHPRCTPTPCGVDPAGDLACRSSGSDNRCRGE